MNQVQNNYSYIIVGAGIAGISAAKKIRELAPQASLLLISNEDRLPYKRTSINKNIAKGFGKEAFQLFDEAWYQSMNFELTFSEVVAINRELKKLTLKNGTEVGYQKLLLAQGALPVVPEFLNQDSLPWHAVHFAWQVEHLMNEASTKNNFLIIGGSIEGLETANQFIKLGKKVTILEQQQNPLLKFFPEKITHELFANLRDAGVTYFGNSTISHVQRISNGHFEVTFSGQTQTFDGLILCSGSKPNSSLAEKAGIKTEKGIVVNEYLQASDPSVFAAGDAAQHLSGIVTGLWHAAEHQGTIAGENMVNLGNIFKPRIHRLKTNVFGGFYFSANYAASKEPGITLKTEQKGNRYREFYLLDNRIQGLVMVNEDANDKLYQKAVSENWTYTELEQHIAW